MHPGLVDRDLKLVRYRPISTCRILDTRRALHASHAERMGHGQKIMKTTECGRSRENKNTILFKKSFFEEYYPRLMHFNYYYFSLQVVGFNPCCFYQKPKYSYIFFLFLRILLLVHLNVYLIPIYT